MEGMRYLHTCHINIVLGYQLLSKFIYMYKMESMFGSEIACDITIYSRKFLSFESKNLDVTLTQLIALNCVCVPESKREKPAI